MFRSNYGPGYYCLVLNRAANGDAIPGYTRSAFFGKDSIIPAGERAPGETPKAAVAAAASSVTAASQVAELSKSESHMRLDGDGTAGASWLGWHAMRPLSVYRKKAGMIECARPK